MHHFVSVYYFISTNDATKYADHLLFSSCSSVSSEEFFGLEYGAPSSLDFVLQSQFDLAGFYLKGLSTSCVWKISFSLCLLSGAINLIAYTCVSVYISNTCSTVLLPHCLVSLIQDSSLLFQPVWSQSASHFWLWSLFVYGFCLLGSNLYSELWVWGKFYLNSDSGSWIQYSNSIGHIFYVISLSH